MDIGISCSRNNHRIKRNIIILLHYVYISRNANFFVIVSASNSSLAVTFIGEENAIIINNGMFENFMENFNRRENEWNGRKYSDAYYTNER